MSTPEMRYIGIDLLTRQITEDLPLYGTSFQRRISGPGNMTGSFKLGTGFFSDQDLLDATAPGRRGLLALRNDQPIWAGPIWSSTYQSQANVVSMTGQSYECIFARIKMMQRFRAIEQDQTTIFRWLIEMMQTQPNCNFGIDTSSIDPCGVNQTVLIETFEQRFYSEPIEDLLKAANSFDYVIDYLMQPGTGNFTPFARTGYPFLGAGQPGIDFDYPGSVSNYYYPESSARGIVRETVLGKGEGSLMPVATYTNQDLVDAGYPMWEENTSEKSFEDLAILSRIAQELGLTRKMPVSIPTMELIIDEDSGAIDFSEWNNLGVPVNFHIQDVRFPNGKDIRSRMLGWDYTPPSSEGVEALKIIIEGQDAA